MFEQVVVGADFSSSGELVLRAVPGLHSIGARRLHLVHVTGMRHPTLGMIEQLTEHRQRLESERAGLEAAGFEVTTEVVMGDPPREIHRVAQECGASLIVMGSRSHSRSRDAFIGSVAWGVVAHASLPVLIYRVEAIRAAYERGDGTPDFSIERVLFATDLSESADRAFRCVEGVARDGSLLSCTLLHVRGRTGSRSGSDEPERSALERLASRIQDVGGAPVEVVICDGDPAVEIVRHAADRRDALIVMSSHGKGLIADALLGSVSKKVLRNAPGPVLLVPSRSAG
jgi:nucleotide-binding universal stress UspA family protein